MTNLAAETKDMGFQLEQLQGFTPMTMATVIYYNGYHSYMLKKVNTPITPKEKKEQHRFFFWYKDENKTELNKLGRQDLLKVFLPDNVNGIKTNLKMRLKTLTMMLYLLIKGRIRLSLRKSGGNY